MRSRSRWFAIAAALMLAGVAKRADACDCAGPGDPFDELVDAEQVFEATVAHRLPSRGAFQPWAVKMLRTWKGTTVKDDAPVFNLTFCGAPLAVGETYIFYTSRDVLSSRMIHRCSRVVPRSNNGDDLLVLGPAVELGDRRAPDPKPPAAMAEQTLPPCPPAGCSSHPTDRRPSPWLAISTLLAVLSSRRARRPHAPRA